MKTTVHAVDKYSSPQPVIHPSHVPDQVGEFAMSLIRQWGLVAAKADGEDSAGRAKLTHLPVGEMVERACDTAEQLFAALADRGYLVELPTWDEFREMARAERVRN